MKPTNDRIYKKIQRACNCRGGGCADCGGAQRAPRGEAPAAVPRAAYDVLRAPGEALDDQVRREHEPALGHDLGDVRIHVAPASSDASVAAGDMNAHAFTLGQHIVMADDAPQPSGPDGRELLRHELTHAVEHQPRWDQTRVGIGMLDIQPTDSAEERDAARAGSINDTLIDAAAPAERATEPVSEPGAPPQAQVPASTDDAGLARLDDGVQVPS